MAARLVWIVAISSAINGQVSKAQDCGQAPLNTKIVGGENAISGAWPWQVSMHVNGFHICGGTLISDQWVLTAAHCVTGISPNVFTIYLGRETQSGPNVNEVNRTVSEVIIHPDYALNNNDIALMKLSSSVNFTDYIRPICLANSSSQFFNSTLCWSTGWGRLNANDSLPSSSPLQEVQVPIIGNKECNRSYMQVENIDSITDQMICAGQENKGACQGDSGGPLQCKQDSMWIQAGITSFGVPCALAGIPEVYARVSEFQEWIKEQVSGAAVGFVTYTSSGTDQDSTFVSYDSSPSTHANELTFIVISVTMFLQHILAQ